MVCIGEEACIDIFPGSGGTHAFSRGLGGTHAFSRGSKHFPGGPGHPRIFPGVGGPLGDESVEETVGDHTSHL
jgi:hypothetical protein